MMSKVIRPFCESSTAYRGLRRFLVLVAGGLTLCGVSSSWAADFRLVPSLELKEEYIDNMFLDEKETVTDFITTVNPKLLFKRNTELVRLNLSGSAGWTTYAKYNQFDNVDQNYLGEFAWQQSSRLSLSLSGAYLQDHRPDRDLLTSGLLFDTVRRDRWTFGSEISYALSERSRLAGGYTYAQEQFPGDDFSDSRIHSVSGSYDYNWTPRLTQNLTLGYSRADYETSRLENLTLQLGTALSLTELWSFNVGIGGRYTHSEFETSDYVLILDPLSLVLVKGEKRHGEFGSILNAGLNYQDWNTRLTLGGGYNVELASGRSGAVEQTSFSVDWRQRLNRELSGVVRCGYYLNRAEAEELTESEIDNRSLRLSAGLHWEFTSDWGTSLDYQFIHYDNDVNEVRADRHLVALRLLYRMPLWD